MANIEEIRHYALETIPSIYDEEALTALQLCGRLGGKVNEIIKVFQDLSRGVADSLEEFQDKTIPVEVRDQINERIHNGEFDKAIDLYCGELRAQLNHILANGSPDKDPELVDARMDHRGYITDKAWPTLGSMLRFWLSELESTLECIITRQTAPVALSMILGYVNTSGQFIKENLSTHKCATVEVVPGEQYRVKTSYGFSMPSFVVQDEGHNPIMYGLTNDGATAHCNYEQVVTMPANARYLIINSMNGYYAGLQRVVGVNSNALDGDYITNALAGVLAGPLKQGVVPGKKLWTAHALKNGEIMALNNGDTSHRVVRYNVQPGRAYNLKTAVSFGCNPYVFLNRSGSVIGNLVVAPEDTTQTYDVKVRAPIGAYELLVYFTGDYNTEITMDMGCIVEASEDPQATGNGYPDWSHLKWYVMGDSLTEANGYASKRYYDYIQDKTGIQVQVDGIGGTGFCAGYRYGESFFDRIENIPQDVDVITVFGSGNDFSALEDEGMDPADVGQYVLDFLDSVRDTHPGVPVLVIPPTPWKGRNPGSVDWTNYCKAFDTAVDGITGPFKAIMDTYKYHPFEPNLNGHVEKFFSKDPTGVHPDENGHRALAPIFYNALVSVLACK